jgi:hypothetical protein
MRLLFATRTRGIHGRCRWILGIRWLAFDALLLTGPLRLALSVGAPSQPESDVPTRAFGGRIGLGRLGWLGVVLRGGPEVIDDQA